MKTNIWISAVAAALVTASVIGCQPDTPSDQKGVATIGATIPGGEPSLSEIRPVKVGNYQIELWPDEEGIYSGEETDIEFGVFDTTKKDEKMGGMLGVEFDATANVTMPAMEGMPAQKPKIHKEGRAGVQGLELFFPHGGDYQIDLTITPKGAQPIKATFTIPVKDDRPEKTAAVKAPYELLIVDWNKHTVVGTPVDLKMRVIDTKTGKSATKFDIAHEKPFHLLIASKNLKQFMHEHPEMSPDGTWTYRATFPAGGEWWVYGDVAPEGKGSRVLVAKIAVHGDEPTQTMHVDNLGPSSQGGLTGRVEMPAPIEVGKMAEVIVKLTDQKSGQPASDIQPYLGAAGHLMIIHEDGQTMVHSHPAHGADADARVKEGEVRFNARFPKPGRYVAYSQFNRGGMIRTLGYTLEVK